MEFPGKILQRTGGGTLRSLYLGGKLVLRSLRYTDVPTEPSTSSVAGSHCRDVRLRKWIRDGEVQVVLEFRKADFELII